MATAAALTTNRPALITADQLAKDFDHVTKAIAEIETNCAAAPPVLEDDEDLEIVGALMKRLNGAGKRVEDIRVEEKEPYLDAGRTVDGFFKAHATKVAKLKSDLQARLDSYMRKKAEAERQRRLEAERVAHEAMLREQSRAAAAVVEADEQPFDENRQAAEAAIDRAAESAQEAHEAAEATQAKPAELARTATSAGTATLETKWSFEITAFALVDLDALRPYLNQEDVEKAIRRFVSINKNTRPLAGVKIFQSTKATIR